METKANWFVRFWISALCLLLGTMVVYRYFWIEPRADITWGLIILIGFLVIVALGEIFDSFSLGKVLSLSRTVKEKEQHLTTAKAENSELRSQMIALYSSVSQRQTSTSTNIVGIPDSLASLISVKKAAEEEIEEKTEAEAQAAASEEVVPRRRVNRRLLEKSMMDRFIRDKALQQYQLVTDAKLVPNFVGVDPISDFGPIFDGYLKTSDQEIFLEVQASNNSGMLFRDRLYVMLSKIHHYRAFRKNNAFLALIIAEIPEEKAMPFRYTIQRALQHFEPAINSGLLRIETYQLGEADLHGIFYVVEE